MNLAFREWDAGDIFCGVGTRARLSDEAGLDCVAVAGSNRVLQVRRGAVDNRSATTVCDLRKAILSATPVIPSPPSKVSPGPTERPVQHVPMPNTFLRRARHKLRAWAAQRRPAVDAWQAAGGPVMVIAPHPDDEVIGCGGTLCRHVAGGDSVSVVYLTRGEKSRGYPWLTAAQRQAKRVQEATSSCAILGVRDTVFLDGEDGNLSEPAMFGELLGKVAAEVAARQPRAIYVPHGDDNHADHIAAYRMICQIVRELAPAPIVYQYELWSPLTADFAVDITGVMRCKVKAIKCHRLALDAFDYVSTMIGLAAYRSGTMLQRKGYAEAFRRTPDLHQH